ncbi:hypothetical protein F2P79_009207 [Pimephales promelas]|nr:hypothetical protein F2P79_009207 [Pimephales promelas]KAG1953669.1 hypothetical protein F2P79_009207 [Pimephales promelas]
MKFSAIKRLQNEKQTLRESNAPADDSGSLQEQVKQVGIMLKMFAHTGQSGADVLESLGDVVRSMDNKMDSMLHHFEFPFEETRTASSL